MASSQRFRSGVGLSFVLGILAVLTALMSSQQRGFQPSGLLLLGASLAFFVWLLLTTDYSVSDDEIVVRCGPVRRHIDTTRVRRVRPTRTLLSAPALSLDRLEISGDFGTVVISPKDRDGFVRALRAAAPQARFEGL